MRGKRKKERTYRPDKRITPADAGKTCLFKGGGHETKDHPRGCGENIEALPQIIDSIGSPPRMRGKRSFQLPIIRSIRITPADAGKTYLFFPKLSEHEDHPRGCGENSENGNSASQFTGSPPRMRGKLFQLRPQKVYNGITPADAGKTVESRRKNVDI